MSRAVPSGVRSSLFVLARLRSVRVRLLCLLLSALGTTATLRAGVDPDLELFSRFALIETSLGGTETYLLYLSNRDPDQTATGVTVQLTLPAGLSVTANDPDQGTYSAGTWTVGSLAPNTQRVLRLTVQGNVAGTHDLTAQVTAQDQPDFDSSPNNDGGSQLEDDETRARLLVAAGCTDPGSILQVLVTCNNNATTDPSDDYYTYTAEVGGSGTYTLEVIGEGGL